MIEAFASQLQTEAGLLCAGLLLALLFMARAWQRERDENRRLQADLLTLARDAVAAEHESATGLSEVRRLVEATAEARHTLGDVQRELEATRRQRLQPASWAPVRERGP